VGAIGALLRRSDLLFRLGGDEFAVLLPETDLAGAADMGERIRQLRITIDGPDGTRLTVSSGGAQYMPGGSPETLVEAADRALYRAKHEGGDRVALATRSSPGAPRPSGDHSGSDSTPSDLPF